MVTAAARATLHNRGAPATRGGADHLPGRGNGPYVWSLSLEETMKKHTLFIASLGLAAASLAHAGKAERDFFAAEVAPAVKTATSTLKQSCGCDVKMDVKQDSFQTVDHLRQVRYAAGTIVDNAPKYCNDAPSKAAVCKLKTLEFARTGTTAFKFAAGKGVITLDESSYPSWDMLAAELDK